VKLSAAFQKLCDEDPSLALESDPDNHQTLLWGQGEMHLKVALDRLKSKYTSPSSRTCRAPLPRDHPPKRQRAHGRHKKQSGGHCQFGDVKIDIRPLPRGEGFAFDNRIVGGAVPKQYIPAVEAGARDFMAKGPLGFPMVDIGVTLTDGQFHTVDSNELSFKMATALALKEGLPNCQPVLLEPILAVPISVPSDATAKALQLVSQKRGQNPGIRSQDRLARLGRDQNPPAPERNPRPHRLAPLDEARNRLLHLGLRPLAGSAAEAVRDHRGACEGGSGLTPLGKKCGEATPPHAPTVTFGVEQAGDAGDIWSAEGRLSIVGTQATPHHDDMPPRSTSPRPHAGKFFKPDTTLNLPVYLVVGRAGAQADAHRTEAPRTS
jgi:hypothetical protein